MTCEDCRFWSEQIAYSAGSDIVAMCFNPNGPKYQKMVSCGCVDYESGPAVDLPETMP